LEKNRNKKKWSKVSNQKRLTVVKCWFTKGKKADEKHSPSHRQNDQLVQSWGLVHSGYQSRPGTQWSECIPGHSRFNLLFLFRVLPAASTFVMPMPQVIMTTDFWSTTHCNPFFASAQVGTL